MEQFQRAKVVMIPTNQKLKNGIWLRSADCVTGQHLFNNLGRPALINECYQHLYITSDDKINAEDWYIDDTNTIRQAITSDPDYWEVRPEYKKIIATTDTSLSSFAKTKCPKCDSPMKVNLPDHIECITCGNKGWNLVQGVFHEVTNLPQPSSQFIEKYVDSYNKGEIITDVMAEYTKYDGTTSISSDWNGKLKTNPKDNTVTIKKVKNSWTKEEAIELIRKYAEDSLKVDRFKNVYFTNNWIDKNL